MNFLNEIEGIYTCVTKDELKKLHELSEKKINGVEIGSYLGASSYAIASSDIKYLFPIPKKIIKQLLAIGLPSAGENISFNLTMFALTAILFANFGENSVITRVYVSKIYMFALSRIIIKIEEINC